MPNDRSLHEGAPRLLWIDGVGAHLVRFGDRLSIGGPGGADEADLVLLANLGRRHAEIVRHGEGYAVEPIGPSAIDGRSVAERAALRDGSLVQLGGGVRLRFRQPSVLSTTCRIEFASDHRPQWSIDGALLVQETLLLGPGDQNHVVCRDWPESVILTRRDGVLLCRSRAPLFVDANPVQGEAVVPDGATVTGTDIRFRIE